MISELITQDFINSKIQKEEYHRDTDDKYCICVLTIENGFKAEGIAHRQWAMKHNTTIARKAAKDKAIEKLWELYTFLSHAYHKGGTSTNKTKDFVEKNELKDKDVFYQTGDIFYNSIDHKHYQIIADNNTGVLASLDGVENFSKLVTINNPLKITENEWYLLTGGFGHYFSKL